MSDFLDRESPRLQAGEDVNEIPHRTFIVHKDDTFYCFGIVFELAAVKQEVSQ
jgi:hypothetical protein